MVIVYKYVFMYLYSYSYSALCPFLPAKPTCRELFFNDNVIVSAYHTIISFLADLLNGTTLIAMPGFRSGIIIML